MRPNLYLRLAQSTYVMKVLVTIARGRFVLATAHGGENDRNTNAVQPFETGRFIRNEEEFHRLREKWKGEGGAFVGVVHAFFQRFEQL